MTLKFSLNPGRRERQLMRRHDNPLFPEALRHLDQERLSEAQRLDHEEIVAFIPHFRDLIQQAVALQPNEESEVILKLKEELDKCYEQACGLADDQSETKSAIRKLIAVIMQAVEAGARNDPMALDELEQERSARDTHFALVEQPLVADLLYPETVIGAEELLATLLSAADDEFGAALTLFDREQLQQLCDQAELQLAGWCGQGVELAPVERRVLDMNGLLKALTGETA